MATAYTTYDGLYKQILLRCPSASVFLARSWMDIAFRTIWDRRTWSWQRAQTQFIFHQLVNDGLATVTFGSYAVSGTGTTWSTDLVGRQFRTSLNNPIYTIESVDAAAQVLQLTEPYAGGFFQGGSGSGLDVYGMDTTGLDAPGLVVNSQTSGYQIYNAYQTVPTDFESLLSIIDVNYNWSLGMSNTLEELNIWDPQRSNIGTPYTVVPFDYDGDPFNDPPLPRYEWWPHQQSQYVYPAWYIRRPPDLSDPGAKLPRNVRGNVLLDLALAQAARWPGTGQAKNPYFDLRLAMQHDSMGERGIRDMEVLDDSIYETDAWYSGTPLISVVDSRWMQRHDV